MYKKAPLKDFQVTKVPYMVEATQKEVLLSQKEINEILRAALADKVFVPIGMRLHTLEFETEYVDSEPTNDMIATYTFVSENLPQGN